MEILHNLAKVLRLNEEVYLHLLQNKKSIRYGVGIIFGLGLVYGATNYWIYRNLLTMMGSKIMILTAVISIIMSGLSIAFIVHAGVVLFVWAMSRGFKGPGNLFLLYSNLGVALAPLWFAVPVASYLLIVREGFVRQWMLLGILVLLCMWFWAAAVQAIKAAEGFSYQKATGVFAASIVFFTSLLYLWLP